MQFVFLFFCYFRWYKLQPPRIKGISSNEMTFHECFTFFLYISPPLPNTFSFRSLSYFREHCSMLFFIFFFTAPFSLFSILSPYRVCSHFSSFESTSCVFSVVFASPPPVSPFPLCIIQNSGRQGRGDEASGVKSKDKMRRN